MWAVDFVRLSDWPSCPTSLLYNGYSVSFQEVKQPELGPHGLLWVEISGAM